MRTLTLLFALALAGGPAWAHGASPHGDVLPWTLDPWVLTPLLLMGFGYAVGAGLQARRAVVARSLLLRRATAYGAGWLTLAAALLSPLHYLGEHVFTFHMIEHEIVMAVSAPLLVLARPAAALLWGLPRGARKWMARLLARPRLRAAWMWATRAGNATLLHGAAIWLWHAPPLFDAAATSEWLHRLQHLSFLLTAVLFWWAVLWRSRRGAAAAHLFITMLHTGILGALMALAPRVLYGAQTRYSSEWGLTPLADQQLAGLVMWVPAGTIYAGAALALVALWVREAGLRAERYDAAPTR